MRNAKFVGLFLIACSVACGHPSADSRASDYIARLGITVKDCGEIMVPQCAEASSSAAVANTLACASDCGTRAKIVVPTVEGDPIDYVVVRTPYAVGGCSSALFVDTTADHFGPQKVIQYQCGSSPIHPNMCPFVGTDGCGPVE